MSKNLVKSTIVAQQDNFLKKKLTEVINSDKSYADILDFINNEIKESTRNIEFGYRLKCFREDGAWALSRAVEAIHGYTTQKNTGPSDDQPPTMIDVRFADGTREKVPFGTIQLPQLGKDSYIQTAYDYDSQHFLLSGVCQKRFTGLMDQIYEEMKRLIETDSIYRCRAIKISDKTSSPTFIDLSKIEQIPLFLTPEAQYSTRPIEGRIEYTERCIRAGIDLKFGVLLEGPYGSGKTLYAFKLALKAIRNDWSFIYCPDSNLTLHVLETANMLAKNGKGVVVFIEDIDKLLYERSDYTNQISVMMDGGETKSSNIITIFTTNHVEDIDPTFMRGKRIGSIVTLKHLDKDTAKQMIMNALKDENGNSILEDDCDKAAELAEKNKIVPAFLAEIVDRVKSQMIYSDKPTVSCQDVISSIVSYQTQMDIAQVRVNKHSKADKLIMAFKDVMDENNDIED